MLLQTRSVKAELKPLSLCFQCFSDPVHAVGSHVACPGKDNPVAELHLKGIFFMAHKKTFRPDRTGNHTETNDWYLGLNCNVN